jgi:DNA-binding response OmpR family regulator
VSQQFRRLQILLVDNDARTHTRVQQTLSDGFALRCVCSLDEARRELDTALPDVLICEVVLADPEASGLDLCRFVRASAAWRQLPILLLTTFSTLQDKVAGFEAGADDYLVKPFDARHLMARIRLLSRLKRLELDH